MSDATDNDESAAPWLRGLDGVVRQARRSPVSGCFEMEVGDVLCQPPSPTPVTRIDLNGGEVYGMRDGIEVLLGTVERGETKVFGSVQVSRGLNGVWSIGEAD